MATNKLIRLIRDVNHLSFCNVLKDPFLKPKNNSKYLRNLPYSNGLLKRWYRKHNFTKLCWTPLGDWWQNGSHTCLLSIVIKLMMMKHPIGQCSSEVYCLVIWHRQLSFLLPTRRSRPLHACWRVSHTDTKANIHISSHPSIPRFPSDVRICCYTMLNSIQQLLFCYHIVCFLCYVIISKSMYPFFSSTFKCYEILYPESHLEAVWYEKCTQLTIMK